MLSMWIIGLLMVLDGMERRGLREVIDLFVEMVLMAFFIYIFPSFPYTKVYLELRTDLMWRGVVRCRLKVRKLKFGAEARYSNHMLLNPILYSRDSCAN